MRARWILGVCGIVLSFLVGCGIFEEEILITSQSRTDGSYTLELYQVGSPQWSFGPVKAKLVLSNAEGDVVDAVELSLMNDGTDVAATNIVEIIWSEEGAEVVMREFDTSKQYRFVLKADE